MSLDRLARLEAQEARLRRMLRGRPDASRAEVWQRALATCRAELRDAYDAEIEGRPIPRRDFAPARPPDQPAPGDGEP